MCVKVAYIQYLLNELYTYISIRRLDWIDINILQWKRINATIQKLTLHFHYNNNNNENANNEQQLPSMRILYFTCLYVFHIIKWFTITPNVFQRTLKVWTSEDIAEIVCAKAIERAYEDGWEQWYEDG